LPESVFIMVPSMHELYRDSGRYPVYWEFDGPQCLPHFHNSLEFTLTLEGCTEAMFCGKSVLLQPGDLFLVSGLTAHGYKRGNRSHVIMLIVPMEFIPLYAPMFSRKVFASVKTSKKSVTDEVLHCLRRLLAIGQCDESSENLVRSYIYVILGLLIREVGLVDASDEKALSQSVLLYLQNNCLSKITLEDLSRRFGYSKYRFSRTFNQSVGCSLTQYVGALRARHAANLLRETDLPLIEICMNSGFDSLRTFYRSFKNTFGITPTQYRKRVEKAVSDSLNPPKSHT
jgi:AraC-like DNA-binding protein